MTLKLLPQALTVCKLASAADIDLSKPFYFAGRTEDELSLVCPTQDVPAGATAREDGWRGLRVAGTLDFSLVGVLSKLTGALADAGVGLFAVSTYDTDYILVRQGDLDRALRALRDAGYDLD